MAKADFADSDLLWDRAGCAEVNVMLITAPADILAQRLLARARKSDGAIATRVDRAAAASIDFEPDMTIYDVGAPEGGTRRLIAAIAIRPKLFGQAVNTA
jgi:ribose 1,5-bisphosphokinase